jgi:hypothetical protein
MIMLHAGRVFISMVLVGVVRLLTRRVDIGMMLGCVILALARRVVIWRMLGGRCVLGWGPWARRAVCVRIFLVAVFAVRRA